MWDDEMWDDADGLFTDDDMESELDTDEDYLILFGTIANELLQEPSDIEEAFIVGSMLAGNAYENAVEERRRLNHFKKKKSK